MTFKILDLLNDDRVKLSNTTNNNITERLLFNNNPNTFKFKDYNNCMSIDSETNKFITKWFPNELKKLWNIINNDTIELQINNFTLFSINNIINRFNNDRTFIDIGLQYEGMGYVIVLAIDIKTKKLFFRRDGGSSDIDRQYYNNLYKDLNVNDNMLLNFNEVINLLFNENIFNYIIDK